MSSDFVELGLLVMAAFTLGIFVGWLAWATAPKRESDLGPTQAGSGQQVANPGLSRWRATWLPTEGDPPKAGKSALTNAGPTVKIGPGGWTTAGKSQA